MLGGILRESVRLSKLPESETVEPQAASTESDIPDDEIPQQPDEIPQQPYVALTSGRALRIPEANAFAASEPTTVVLLAGPHESGKTTLLASIFERFRSGPFVGHNLRDRKRWSHLRPFVTSLELRLSWRIRTPNERRSERQSFSISRSCPLGPPDA